ncbi:hypothetical protein H8356DRAFT_1432951 [Neocallimastix lanati (nom. inval.)]|nr:hypothetical protein H8356DRAFT_1432951 [Neocallimastix sp. JGI-2020a]
MFQLILPRNLNDTKYLKDYYLNLFSINGSINIFVENFRPVTDSNSSNVVYSINNNNNRNNNANNSSISGSENRNINIGNSENNSIVTNNVVNNSIGENSVNISNFLNNECINKYVTWYRLYNFLLDGRDADVIDLNYKKEWDVLFNKQIISGDYLKMSFLVGSVTLFTEIVLRTSIQQELLFREYKRKLTRMVNVENSVRQAS